MGHTVLVDFEAFETHALRLPSGVAETTALPNDLVENAGALWRQAFKGGDTLQEDTIAENFVNVVNADDHGGVLHSHRAVFTGHKASNDGAPSKVDAGLYSKSHMPHDGRPDWNNIRLFIEFKRKGTHLDPFDDYEPDVPEAEAQTRKAVRNQITAYALQIRNRQHRTCIYGLFVIGAEYRVLRYDQSGVIVTKKQNYVEDPRPLLSFLAWFDRLLPEGQGYDPTATLLRKGSRAYKLMDDFSKEQDSDMPHEEGSHVPATYTSPQPIVESAGPEHSGPAYHTRRQAKLAAVSYDEDESYLDAVELDNEDPRVFAYVRQKFKHSLADGWPRYKLEVGPENRVFLIGAPIWVVFSLYGRGTRGYVALDVRRRRLVFLKDCWRPYYQDVEPEGNYLERLNLAAKEEPELRVPTVVAHGDVAGQVALTAQFAQYLAAVAREAKDATPTGQGQAASRASPADVQQDLRGTKSERPLAEDSTAEGGSPESPSAKSVQADGEGGTEYRLYTHYRIVVKDICLAFTDVVSSRQLVRCIFDCMTTHALAYTKARLLHRDVSAGNVIILPTLSPSVDKDGNRKVTWSGILTDWELAKTVPAPNPSDSTPPKETPRQPERTGTWQFMSVAYVKHHPSRPVSIADELESFFHVLLFYAVRLLRHNIANVHFFVAEYFDHYSINDGSRRDVSAVKRMAMHFGKIRGSNGPLRFNRDATPTHYHDKFNTLIATLLSYFKARYAVLEWEDQEIQGTSPSPTPAPTPTSPAYDSGDEDSDSEDELPRPGLKRNAVRHIEVVPDIPEPSAAERETAKTLDRHDEILDVFWSALRPKRAWPKGDVVADRLGDDYDPRRLRIALDNMCSTTAATATAIADTLPEGSNAGKKRKNDALEQTALFKAPEAKRSRTAGISVSEPSMGRRQDQAKGKGKARART
ncbi:hypothetical protein FKP32DRAFT_1329420 [Trametes sanguinea]|nr:hypothetical protein FKP32DRAFT_1329420 [Trametes sanguinea]